MKVLGGHCTGCKICLLICSQEHFGVWNPKKASLKIREGAFQEKYTPFVCDQCGKCVEACPVHALELNGGLVSLDKSLCNLCQACVEACPQEVIFMHKDVGHIIKCHNCYECVRNCPAGALAI